MWDRLASAVTGVSGISAEVVYLDNEQAPSTSKHRGARILPVEIEDSGLVTRIGGTMVVRTGATVVLSYRLRPTHQDTDRQAANADIVAVYQAIETDSSLRSGTHGGARVRGWRGPFLSASGDYLETEIRVEWLQEVALA